jgi:uncharacterized protein (TIGR02266 family)
MAEASSTEDVITLRIRFKSDTLEKFTERYAADLTQNEIFIRTRDPLPVGTNLALDLSLHDGSSLITGRGSVAWTRGPELTRDAPSGMGIRFDALTGGSRQMLQRILEAKARLANNQPAFPATLERTEPSRTTGSSADLPVAVGRPTERTAPPRPSRPSNKSMPAAAAPAITTPAAPVPSRATRPPAGKPATAATVPPAAAKPAATTAATTVPAATIPSAPRPAAPVAPTRPMRSAFSDDEAEPTELANVPPTFFYEGADADQEKTRLQDPRASAALLQQERQHLDDDEELEADDDDDGHDLGDDDVTNVRSAASLYGGVAKAPTPRGADPNPLPNPFAPPPPSRSEWGMPAARPDRSGVRPERRTPSSTPSYGAPNPSNTGRPERRTPPSVPSYSAPNPSNTGRPERRTPATLPSFGAPNPAVTREIKAPVPPTAVDNLTDHHPLILSTRMSEADDPMTPDPAPAWPPPLPQATAFSPPSYEEEPEPYLETPPPAGAGPQRWGPGTLDTLPTAPSLPSITGTTEPHVMMTPAWPVPAVDPHARLSMSQPLEEEPAPGRMSSAKMWVALTLAAGGIVAAALLLLPALLRPAPATPTASAPAEPSRPAADPASPAPSDPTKAPAEDPAKLAAAPPAATPPAAAAPSEGTGTPAPAATPPAAAVPAVEAKPEPPAPAADTPRPGGKAVRPGKNTSSRRSTREVIAAAESRERVDPPAAPEPPPAEPAKAIAPPSPAAPGEGAEDVYWLTVRSIPSGADVLIDGQVEGQTPFVRRIFDPSRSYSLTVRRAGFEPHDRTLSTTDVWTKRGNVRTLTVVAKLTPAAGLPTQAEPAPPVAPSRGAEPSTPSEPPLAPPPVEPDRKNNPFAEPGAPGGAPQPQ